MERNRRCHCGSGFKYKFCCLYKEQGFVKGEQGWEKPSNSIMQDIMTEIRKAQNEV